MNWDEASKISDSCDDIINDLDALERAILDICPTDMVYAIHDRKRMIRKR